MKVVIPMSVKIYGKNPCQEILATDKTILGATLIKGSNIDFLKAFQARKVPFTVLEKVEFEKLYTGNHQGIVIEVPDYPVLTIDETIHALKGEKHPLVIMLDGIEDPHNFGAILRTAEAGGAQAVVIMKQRAVGITGTVAKAASGALEHLRVAETPNLSLAIEKFKKAGYWVYGTDLGATKPYTDIPIDTPLVLVIGSEGKGISRLVKENCDANVLIPMVGKANSLNASVSAGILIFDILRRRT